MSAIGRERITAFEPITRSGDGEMQEDPVRSFRLRTKPPLDPAVGDESQSELLATRQLRHITCTRDSNSSP